MFHSLHTQIIALVAILDCSSFVWFLLSNWENKCQIVYGAKDELVFSSCIRNALVRRHLVYLIVECLTQYHTWLPQQNNNDIKIGKKRTLKERHGESTDYLPCNLMEIFAIYFPFCQCFFPFALTLLLFVPMYVFFVSFVGICILEPFYSALFGCCTIGI